MKYSEETLMAFADGELDAALRAEIAAALAGDAELARRVAAHRALRERVRDAYAAELEAPAPQRLLDVLGAGNVVALDAVRARQTARRTLPRWTALAASLVIGVCAGYLAFQLGSRAPVSSRDGALVADAALERSLTRSLSGEGGAAAPKIWLSYRSKAGELCRSFTQAAFAGIACREGGDWRIRMLAQGGRSAVGDYRAAGSDLPAAVRASIDADIAGEPLDAAGERAARGRDWRAQ